MRSSILATIPGFRQRIIPEPSFPSQGSQARGTRLYYHVNEDGSQKFFWGSLSVGGLVTATFIQGTYLDLLGHLM